MASIGWIDFSPTHRDRVAAILDLLRPEGVVDELGIGSIRDALSDQMFPGISTIQTKAKYFLIIPHILGDYQRLFRNGHKGMRPETYLEEREYEIMWDLAERYNHKEGTGVIGITKRKPEKIIRRPSAIYWNGLEKLGLVRHGGLDIKAFLRSRENHFESLAADLVQGDDSPGDDADAEHVNRFELHFPYHRGWASQLTLDLTWSEAKLLADRILLLGDDTLLCSLMADPDLFRLFRHADTFADFSRIAVSQGRLSTELERTLVFAHDFSEVLFGAHLGYNGLLQQRKFGSDSHEGEWTAWAGNLRSRMLDPGRFEPENAWQWVPNLADHTRKFFVEWWKLVRGGGSHGQRDALIEDQESNTKRSKARLRRRLLDDVQEGKWKGLKRLEYRRPQVRQILADIYESLGPSDARS